MDKIAYIYAKNPSIDVVGIAVDNEKEIVEKTILKFHLEWDNIFLDDKLEDVSRKIGLQINAFPMYILTDKRFKILFKSNNITEINEFIISNPIK